MGKHVSIRTLILVSALLMSQVGISFSFLFGFSAYAVFFILCVPLLYLSIARLRAEGAQNVKHNIFYTTLKVLLWAGISYGTFLFLIAGPVFWFPHSHFQDNVFVSGTLIMLSAIPLCYFLYRVVPRGDIWVPLYPSAYLFIFGYIASILYPVSNTNAIYTHTLGWWSYLAYDALLVAIYILAQASYLKSFKNTASITNADLSKHWMQQIILPLVMGWVFFVTLHILIDGFSVNYPSCC
jgi:hypothetical protein